MHANFPFNLLTSETFSLSSHTYTPCTVNAVLAHEFAFADFLYMKASLQEYFLFLVITNILPTCML